MQGETVCVKYVDSLNVSKRTDAFTLEQVLFL